MHGARLFLFCLEFSVAVMFAAPAMAQLDTVRARKLAREINFFRIRNFKKPLSYNVSYQHACDSFVKVLPINRKHDKFSKYQVGEVFQGYGSGLGAWRHSPPHRRILLSSHAKEIVVSVFTDEKGDCWSVGRTYRKR
jgi:hypothetical protein